MNKQAAARWVVALTGIGSLMAALDTLVVSTALSTIRLDRGASVEQLEWTVNAYNLSFAVLLITGAALGDRYGRRKLYALGLRQFAVASAACVLAPLYGLGNATAIALALRIAVTLGELVAVGALLVGTSGSRQTVPLLTTNAPAECSG